MNNQELQVLSQKPAYTVRFGEYSACVELAPQRLEFDIPERRWAPWKRFATVVDGLEKNFIPGYALSQKAKLFDDRLMFAIETALHMGLPGHCSKRAFVEELLKKVQRPSACGVLLAAQTFFGKELSRTPSKLYARKLLDPFLSDPLKSLPIGFYSESPEGAAIFKFDRFLQQQLDPEDVKEFATALSDNPELAQSYQWHLHTAAALTGPHSIGSVASGDSKAALYPSSRTPETEIVKELYGTKPIPETFNVADELIGRLRDGRLDLSPNSTTPWYWRQLHAFSALLCPDTDRLTFTPEYKSELEERFKSLFALARETHIKQAEMGIAGAAMPPEIEIAPRISVEPLLQYYERQSAIYRWLGHHLESLLGQSFMDLPLQDCSISIRESLTSMQLLFEGAQVVSRQETGESIKTDDRSFSAISFFRTWQGGANHDPDLGRDLRCMVPIYFDMGRGQIRVRVVTGVEERQARARFVSPPKVDVYDSKGMPATVEVSFASSGCRLLHPSGFECNVNRILDREEFRALCDRYESQEELRSALETLT